MPARARQTETYVRDWTALMARLRLLRCWQRRSRNRSIAWESPAGVLDHFTGTASGYLERRRSPQFKLAGWDAVTAAAVSVVFAPAARSLRDARTDAADRHPVSKPGSDRSSGRAPLPGQDRAEPQRFDRLWVLSACRGIRTGA
jgi:hypothetical protein